MLWDDTIDKMANIMMIYDMKMHYLVKNHNYTLTIRFNASDALKIRYATGLYESTPIDSPVKTYKIQVQKASYGLDRLWSSEHQYFIYEPKESGIYSLGSYGDETSLYYCDITNDDMFKYNDLNYQDIDIEDSLVNNADDIPYFKKGNKYLLMISISSCDEEYIFNPKLSLITEETDNLKKITIEKTGTYELKFPESKFVKYKFYDEETTMAYYISRTLIQLYEGMTLWYVVDDKYGLDSLEYTGYDMRCYVDGEEIINGHSYKYKLEPSKIRLSLTYNGENVKATSNHFIIKSGSNYSNSGKIYFEDGLDEDEINLGFSDSTYVNAYDINFVTYKFGNVKVNYKGTLLDYNFDIFTQDIRG